MFNQAKDQTMPLPIDETNPLARAKRAIETLDSAFPGFTMQVAATQMLQDLMHLEDAEPNNLHLIGALEDARNQHETIAQPSVEDSGKVVSLEQARFEAAHAAPGETGAE